MRRKRGIQRSNLFWTCLSFGISLVLFIVIYDLFIWHDYQQNREKCNYIAKNEINGMITTIDCVMVRVNTLRMLVLAYEGNTDFFERVASELYESVEEETGVELRNILLAPDGVVTQVYPVEGNEILMGFNYLDSEKPGNQEAIEAFHSYKTILTNPFELVQGGLGIAGRAPVILQRDGQEQLWGLVSVTMDFDNLINKLNLDNLSGMGISYELSYLDDDGKIHIMKSQGRFRYKPVVKQFKVRNLTWQIKMMPSEGWVSMPEVVLSMMVILLLSALVGVITHILFRLRESYEKLKYTSYRDGLTETFSRNYVKSILVNSEDGSWKLEGNKYSLLIIDIDDFKHFNDEYGHETGDAVIEKVAKILKRYIIEELGDCVIRYGGDEFVILMNLVDKGKVQKFVQNIERDIRNISFKNSPGLKVTVSGGVCLYEDMEEHTYTSMINEADRKLYIAKEQGKNQIVF